jgi:hypothetical protein
MTYISRGLADRAALSDPEGLEFVIAEIVKAIRSIQQQIEGGSGDMGEPEEALVPDVGITTLAGLEDVSLVGPVTGQALIFNGLTWGNTEVASSLEGLTDTTISGPTDGQFLRYDSGVWVNETFTVSLALDDLSDVSASSPGSGAFLRYVGSSWVPAGLDTPDTAEDILDSLPDLAGMPTEEDPLGWVTTTVCVDGVDQTMQVVARYVAP